MPLARKLYRLARKIGQGFDRQADFPKEWNSSFYFRLRKIRLAIKD
jgi:hypothetical protein